MHATKAVPVYAATPMAKRAQAAPQQGSADVLCKHICPCSCSWAGGSPVQVAEEHRISLIPHPTHTHSHTHTHRSPLTPWHPPFPTAPPSLLQPRCIGESLLPTSGTGAAGTSPRIPRISPPPTRLSLKPPCTPSPSSPPHPSCQTTTTTTPRYEFANGDLYTGQWLDDRRTGQGTYFYANGDIFTGGWVGVPGGLWRIVSKGVRGVRE